MQGVLLLQEVQGRVLEESATRKLWMMVLHGVGRGRRQGYLAAAAAAQPHCQ
jgi:hypothetical protein